MNLTFILGIVGGFILLIIGMSLGSGEGAVLGLFQFGQLANFADAASIFIVLGGTLATIIAGHPGKMLAKFPKHLGIIFNQKKFNPTAVIDEVVEFAQIARKNGLLALEERANQLEDPFFKKSIMLIVDGNDSDKDIGYHNANQVNSSNAEQRISHHP